MSNINTNPSDDFDLFATEVEDNLQEQIAKGTYKWTNKYTAILGALVVITASVSGGIWYGNSHAASATTNALSNFASRIRGAAAGGAFTGAAGAGAGAAGAGAFAGAGAAGGTSGFGGGGFGGGSRLSGTIAKVNGNTVTITLDAAPSTPIAAGDAVSVRDTGAAGAATGATGAASNGAPAGAAAGGTAPTGTKRTRGTAAAGGTTSGTAPATGATSGQPSVGGGAGGGNGGAGGGRFNNPAFTACLAKNGVTLAPGARPDRTDPKVAAALQACFSTLGGGAPGAGGPGGGGFGGGNGGGARPAPTATP